MDTKEKKVSICPHCKQEVDAKATRCPHCHGKISRMTLGKLFIAGIFAIFVISIATAGSHSSSTPTTSAVPQLSAEELATWQKTPAGKLCAKHTDWKKDDCDALVARKYWIGMTYDMLVYERGKPQSVNPSDYGSGVRYQYCWNDNITPRCFYDDNDDNVIDSYN
ncbi:hypothetical protein BH11PAT2_BH11PAT2_01550 [soil metagenome]